MSRERIIGKFSRGTPGPLLVCLAGMHGNEPAGIEALEVIFQLLENEPIVNPDFKFKGKIIGLRGNLQAMKLNVRFIEKDLNRQWFPENIDRIKATPKEQLKAENLEIKELLQVIDAEIEAVQPEEVIFLDLHTTAAHGGIFSIPNEDPRSIQLAVHLNAPVIRGMLQGVKGTTLHYFNNSNFAPNTTAIAFESGQHEDILSVNRSIAAITNCMATLGMVEPDQIENRHDALLVEFSENLPKVASLIYRYGIEEEDQFKMRPGYHNFQKVLKGELLAHDKNGPIYSPQSGLILMPLYQPQGEDGFFLIQEDEPEFLKTES